MATFKAVIFHGGRHLKKDGTTNIKVRIYHNGSAQYIPTEYFIEPDFMNADVWGIERSGFFNGQGKWAKGFENQMV